MKCPKCEDQGKKRRSGWTEAGSQRYRCNACGHRFTPEPRRHGYDEATRLRAVGMYVDGMNLRRIARQLGVNHQSVANWVKAYTSQLPPAPQPETVETVEMDELFTFIGDKKAKSI